MNRLEYTPIMALLLLLAACGGSSGGGGSEATPVSDDPTPVDDPPADDEPEIGIDPPTEPPPDPDIGFPTLLAGAVAGGNTTTPETTSFDGSPADIRFDSAYNLRIIVGSTTGNREVARFSANDVVSDSDGLDLYRNDQAILISSTPVGTDTRPQSRLHQLWPMARIRSGRRPCLP